VLYAELDEYSPLDENIQIIASSWADRLTSLSHCHMFTKMLISSVEVIRCNPLSHFLSCKPSATDIFFLQASLYMLGTISLGHSPSSHLSCQKLTFLPLPRLIIVQALNKLTSVSLCLMFMFAHGLFGSFHLYHCHLKRKAMLNFERPRMPSPPSFFCHCTRFQLTRQLPFLGSSDSCQRKFILSLSIFLIAHFDRGKSVM
jgi:hypothetical protein